jgi:hypothetical protein
VLFSTPALDPAVKADNINTMKSSATATAIFFHKLKSPFRLGRGTRD